jgi:hypothetical protein
MHKGFNVINIKLIRERNTNDNIAFGKYIKYCIISIGELKHTHSDIDLANSSLQPNIIYFVLDKSNSRPFTVYLHYPEDMADRNIIDSLIVAIY